MADSIGKQFVSADYGQNYTLSSARCVTEFNYSFELHEYNEALTPYGTIETRPPDLSTITIDDFNAGEHFRTGPEDNTNHLQLELEDRLLTIILDESGSMTWNDNNGDRYTYIKRLLTKLDNTYPGGITANLLTFGGSLTRTSLFVAPSGVDFLADEDQSFEQLIQASFQDSVFDFSGVRVVRRTDRFPEHPADGIVVGEGIFEAVKDEDLIEGQTYYYGVWTFNKNKHFSRGKFVSGTPYDRILPSGVNFASGTQRILPGVERSDIATLIYNFVERSGSLTFDSSGSGLHGMLGSEVVESNFWEGTPTAAVGTTRYIPVGVNFDGEYDIIETDITAQEEDFKQDTSGIIVNLWVNPNTRTTNQWLIGTSTEEPSNYVGWMLGLNSTGQLIIQGSNSGILTTGLTVTDDVWSMITVRLVASTPDNLYFWLYLNGEYIEEQNWVTDPLVTGLNRLYIGGKPVSSGAIWSGEDYFGAIAQLSVHSGGVTGWNHNGVTWVSTLYERELSIFTQTVTSASQTPPDNNQREVLLNWDIGRDFDFEGGSVYIVRKYNSLPSHINDGDTVVNVNAEPGEFFYLDTFNFIHGGDYYYRFFTINSIGNICDREEARAVAIRISYSIEMLNTNPDLPVVENELTTPGNKKLLLQWTNPSEFQWRGTKVFYSPDEFPTIKVSKSGISSSGTEIVDTTEEFFAHRVLGQSRGGDVPLTNGHIHYYTIVTYDTYGRLSEARLLQAVPSALLDTVFDSDDVADLHLTILNPTSLSVQWSNPTLSTEKLELYFGESAVIFVGVRDIFGGDLEDIDNLEIQVCTSFQVNSIIAGSQSLGNDRGPQPGSVGGPDLDGYGDSGTTWPKASRCFSPEGAKAETILSYAPVKSGLIKGLLSHTDERDVLARRKSYTMSLRAQYKVEDPETKDTIFEFNTSATTVEFQHPLKMSLINKLNKRASLTPGARGLIRGYEICSCSWSDYAEPHETEVFDGGYINATEPYVVRCEVMYKGEGLPAGTPVTVSLFSHRDSDDPEFLSVKSSITSITEGTYLTQNVFEGQLDYLGNPTGDLVSKSVVEVSIQHPSEPDWVDIYVSLDYLGFLVDGVHSARFVGTLFLTADISYPNDNGIDISEQFATAWMRHPDFPKDPSRAISVPDGTLIKWELIKGQFGKERPFYSTEELPNAVSGVYSTTRDGVARDVFFGPVGNIESHHIVTNCGGDTPSIECCVGEEYTIKASIISGDQSAFDGFIFNYACDAQTFTDKRFFVNAATSQPGDGPHWITWGDGEHLLKFQIASNPVEVEVNLDLDMLKIEEYNDCVDNIVGGQNFNLPEGHVVQITSPGEILWDVSFDEDPYTGELTPISYQSISPEIAINLGIPHIANIPLRGTITDFYVRYNVFVNTRNPKPSKCHGGGGGGDIDLLDCQYRNICAVDGGTIGQRWDNVGTMYGTTTFIVNNKQVTLRGGGDYEDGIHPIKLGFKEPLNVRIIEARDPSGGIVRELVVDGSTRLTFVVEVKFANEPVPDGTRVELEISGAGQEVVLLSSCAGSPPGCNPVTNGIIYTRQINDFRLNPENDKRSFAFFTIEPIPNVSFDARINVTCRYDKLGTVDREIMRCIQVQNSLHVPGDPGPTPEPEEQEEIVIQQKVTSKESIVYDTVQDLYESTRASQIGRMGQFMTASSFSTVDEIYIMGGYTGLGLDIANEEELSNANITPYCEVFNSSTQEWTFVANMPTARCCGSAIESDGKIYCIGGLEKDPGPVDQYIVSRKIESYNIRTGVWNSTLAPMPEDYGMAFGDAQVAHGNIYVVCGITTILGNSRPGNLNNKILRYSIDDDEWIVITPSDEQKYQRLSPFGFYRSSPHVDSNLMNYYIYSGSIPKEPSEIEAEQASEVNRLLNQFRSFILTSKYYLNLPPEQQEIFVEEEEEKIREGVIVSPFIYLGDGFVFHPGAEVESSGEWAIDISTSLEDSWPVLPKARDRGKAVYIPLQDVAYFIGGANLNQSTTLNRVESIDLSDGGTYTQLTSMNRGRALFGTAAVADDIYLSGGLTSGHRQGWTQIQITQSPSEILATGVESGGVLIQLTNDSGEIIDADVRIDVRGRLRILELDSILIKFLANRAADRALGGDGSGSATDLPGEDDETDVGRLIESQNTIINPNSDQFQFNAARKLGEEVTLFPVLYSSNETSLVGGVGAVVLKPRSEDPLANLDTLAEFINQQLTGTPEDSDERFEGDLTREELAALGEVLNTIKLPPTVIESGSLRNLYKIETVVTVLDDYYFGQTISDFDLNLQDLINSRIEDLLTPPLPPEEDDEENPSNPVPGIDYGGFRDFSKSGCLVLEHSAQPDIPPEDTAGDSDIRRGSGSGNGGIPGGPGSTGQCLFCDTILPLKPEHREQFLNPSVQFYNYFDWIPQVRKRITGNTASLSDVIDSIDTIDHETPFGGSQLYGAMFETGRIMSGDDFDTIKKVIYICSDNSQNLSLRTRRDAIDEINSIDGDQNVPVVYTVLSTSFPLSLAAQLQRADTGDVVKITDDTGGQSSTLVATRFLDNILNLTLGAALGGLGYGVYQRVLIFDELSAITSMTTDFYLPQNTQGYVRFRHSSDGFNYSDFTERFEGSGYVDFVDFFAKSVDFEVTLTTGFTKSIEEEYDADPTGIPKLRSIVLDTSGEREDYIYLNKEDVLTNAQQVAASFEGSIPTSAIVEVGAATSESHDWRDFSTPARPAVREFGKIFMLDRTDSPSSIIPIEPITSKDQLLYTSTYGAWSPDAAVRVYEIREGDTEVEVLGGFRLYPRYGQVLFSTRQDPDKIFKLTVVNDDSVRVGVKLRNRLHSDSITMEGIGYIYSTNDEKPAELSQVAPRATNVAISPTEPNSNDTLFAIYDYIDLNNDTEQGTLISWFNNGKQLLEIQNKTNWSDADLLPSNKLQPNDKLYFTVTPSDGRDFGSTVISPTVVVTPQEPGVSDVRLIPTRGGVVSARFDTSSTITLEYDFETDDVGSASYQSGTIIRWFVNGILFKEGVFTEIVSPDMDKDELQAIQDANEYATILKPEEIVGGVSAYEIGNQLYVEVTPRTLLVTGSTVRSNTIAIENSLPIASDVSISPEFPTTLSTLVVSFVIDDVDILRGIQTDQTEIRWFRSINGTDFLEQDALRDSTTVTPTSLTRGDYWHVEITPFDGLEVSDTIRSRTVTIL